MRSWSCLLLENCEMRVVQVGRDFRGVSFNPLSKPRSQLWDQTQLLAAFFCLVLNLWRWTWQPPQAIFPLPTCPLVMKMLLFFFLLYFLLLYIKMEFTLFQFVALSPQSFITWSSAWSVSALWVWVAGWDPSPGHLHSGPSSSCWACRRALHQGQMWALFSVLTHRCHVEKSEISWL